jgi:alkylation response protein AidB-like acyl-CoA dehydrogenase
MTTEEIRSPLYTAKELAPTIRSCADQIEADRELPRPLFEALADAGFFKLMIPRAIGGAEIDLPTYIHVLEELGKADSSTAWVVNQCAVFATYAARMPRDVARLIWIDRSLDHKERHLGSGLSFDSAEKPHCIFHFNEGRIIIDKFRVSD